MSSLSSERSTKKRGCEVLAETINVPLAASTKIFKGAIVTLDSSGNAVAGAAFGANMRGLGRATETVDNSSGLAGALSVDVERGVFLYANSSSTDALTKADVGSDCYMVDDQTVARTDGAGLRGVAGTVIEVTSSGVWVEFAGKASGALEVKLAAGEDLSTHQYKLVKVHTDGTIMRAGAGEKVFGVLQNAPAAAALAIVRTAGPSLVKADATGFTRGDAISSAAGGLARASTDQATGLGHTVTNDASSATDPLLGAYVIGIAIETAAASATKQILITHAGAVAHTAV